MQGARPGGQILQPTLPMRVHTGICFYQVTDDPRGAGQPIARNVVVATSLEPEAAAAVQWAAQQLCQKGDAVHLVHVARCMSTPAEVRSRHLSFGTTDILCMT